MMELDKNNFELMENLKGAKQHKLYLEDSKCTVVFSKIPIDVKK